ncbi:MAG: hypothetical protein IKB49_00875 [Alphaproteobacteria bacterium]|nr:hypothetical protein [Alphaproteobacteria bacterium]
MAVFYCKCLRCNHTGSIKIASDKCTGNFICSKCGSRDVEATSYGAKKAIAQHLVCENYDIDMEKEYYNELYENTVFEEERQLDKMMMAPTGWEDDKDIQDYIGLSPEDVAEDDDVFYDKTVW